MLATTRHHVPDGAHETVDEELVLLRGCLFSRVPDLAIAALHKPLFEVNRVRNVGVRGERVRGERKRLERGVEVGDAVLCEEADEVQTTEGVFAR